MKKLFIILFALAVLNSQPTRAGGYAGNGGGLVEQNFNFAYATLPRLIDGSLVTIPYQFNEMESSILRRIALIASENVSNAKRLIFLSGQKHPEIFNTSPEELHRLAVTTFTPGDTIFINGDLLYSADGKPTLALGEMISILTHELGHQAGEENHQLLDIIGSKLRNYYNQSSFEYEISKNDETLTFSVLNQKGSYSTGQLVFQNSSKVINLTPAIIGRINEIMQKNNYQNLSGFFLTNGNFKLEQIPQDYIFQIWVNANFAVKEAEGFTSKSELIPIEFKITENNLVQIIR